MTLPRLPLALSFCLLAAAALRVSPGEAASGEIKEVVPGVWFREGERDQGHCNNIIIEMEDSLLLIDANFPSGAKAVLADAKKLSPKPVKLVFVTHHHGDHAYGNAVWTRLGAVTIAHAGVAEEMRRYEPESWRGAARSRPDVAELGLDTAEPPRQTFTDVPHAIKDSHRTVELYFFGWAHTRGDGFAYLPKEKILCTGDAVVNGPYNFVGHANIGNWPKVLEKAAQLDVRYVLPGHGGLGGKELIAGQRQFFIELHKAVSAAVKEGKKAEELKSLKLPPDVGNWVGNSLPAQIDFAYHEITQGKPVGEIRGGR